ncbi:DUF4350 domain-containing protein [Actinorugispora endophytica]|uniref:Uncharacterized protein DUF4350 n=1 Tax=Actinorugispora endophytica TaxID=1605990 RepID=A0A4V3D8J0_9ACTN|nr:DUF4350 domain-containing protein [Actinorugispora endophytica]TDQ51957.1 uncharacterized protein DUF4350 [Actinorugispora endophytica]
MSTTTPSPAGISPAAPESSAVSVGVGGLWRMLRGPLAFVLAGVVIAVVLSLGARPVPEGDLDPEGPNPEGSRALVQLLRNRGTDVTVARSTEEAAAATGPDSVLLVVQSHRLLPEEVDRISALPGDRLLVQPTTQLLKALAPGVAVSGRLDDRDPLAPGCALEAAELAGAADTAGELYSGGSTACYPAAEGSALVRAAGDGGTVTVLGTGTPLRNAFLADEGNAALMLNLLAGRDVVWFAPDVPPVGLAEPGDLLAPGFLLSVPALLAALALLALWRGRRLGPLVAEQVPVVVRASETTEGRARLYASRRARGSAAAALRSGLVGRLRPGLGLGPDATPEAVVAAVSARCAHPPQKLRALLYGVPQDGRPADDPFTRDDPGLVRLADELDGLEREVRQS